MTELEEQAPMTITKGILYYLGTAMVVYLYYTTVGWLGEQNIIPKPSSGMVLMIMMVAPYLAAGIFLSKLVLSQLISWEHVLNTVSSIAGGKVVAIVFWPFYYPLLFIRLFIVQKL